MKSKLLIVGGVIQFLIVILHIGIFFGVASSSELAVKTKESLYIFNAAVLVTVMFFTYTSLFRRQDLLNTSLGKIACWFIAVFYLQRGLVETFLRGFELENLVPCLILAAIYVVAAIPSKPQAQTA